MPVAKPSPHASASSSTATPTTSFTAVASIPGTENTDGTQQGVATGPAPDRRDEPPGPPGPPPSPEALLKKLDRNGNGTLESAEAPPFLADADADKSGTITLDELRAHGNKVAPSTLRGRILTRTARSARTSSASVGPR